MTTVDLTKDKTDIYIRLREILTIHLYPYIDHIFGRMGIA